MPKNIGSSTEAKNIQFETPPTVLLVDDNYINRKIGMELLKKLNIKVLLAECGQQAIDMVKETLLTLF